MVSTKRLPITTSHKSYPEWFGNPLGDICVQLNWFHRQDYIHREGVCHRDLKPENIMLDAAGVLKISDFGLCSVYKLKESGKTRLLSERCGSLPYIAPEVSVSQSLQPVGSQLPSSLPEMPPTRRSRLTFGVSASSFLPCLLEVSHPHSSYRSLTRMRRRYTLGRAV